MKYWMFWSHSFINQVIQIKINVFKRSNWVTVLQQTPPWKKVHVKNVARACQPLFMFPSLKYNNKKTTAKLNKNNYLLLAAKIALTAQTGSRLSPTKNVTSHSSGIREMNLRSSARPSLFSKKLRVAIRPNGLMGALFTLSVESEVSSCTL